MSELKRLLDILETKVARRRYLNRPEVQQARNAIAGPNAGVLLTFREAEALIALLRSLPSPPAGETP